MQPDEFIASMLIFLVIMTPFVLYAFLRFLRHRETLFLAERGLLRPAEAPRGNGNSSLRWGIILAALGIALSCGLYPIGWMVGGRTFLGFGPWMLPGFVALALGLGLVLIHRLTGAPPENGGGASAPGAPSIGTAASAMGSAGPAVDAAAEIVPSAGAQQAMDGDALELP